MPQFIIIEQSCRHIRINDECDFVDFLSSFSDRDPEIYNLNLSGIIWTILIFRIDNNFKSKFQKYISSSTNIINPYIKKFYYEYISPLADPEHIILTSISPNNQFPENYIGIIIDLFSISLEKYNSNISNDFNGCLQKALTQMQPFLSSFGNILQNYTLYDSDDKGKIGESDRNKRKCRFCGNTIKDGTTFSNKAHIIPEAFGNKKFICNEECDK